MSNVTRATTSARLFEQRYDPADHGRYTHELDDGELSPVAPDHSYGWRLVGSAANSEKLFWFWEKEVN